MKNNLSLRAALAEGLKVVLAEAEKARLEAEKSKVAQAQPQLFITPVVSGQAIADAVRNLKLKSFQGFKLKKFRFSGKKG
jgi:hypothetical protein